MNPPNTPPASLPVTPPTDSDFNLVDALRDQEYENVYSLNYGAAGRAVRAHVAAEVASATAELKAEIARLSAENKELREDKARLDFLDKFGAEHDLVYEVGDPDVGVFPAWQVWHAHRSRRDMTMVSHEQTARAAIDAARSSAKEG